MCEKLDFDYLISGNHTLFLDDKGENIAEFYDVLNFPVEDQKAMIKRHFQTIIKVIESGLFDFVAHLDYARKHPLCGKDDFIDEKIQVIESLAKHQTAAEISTKGLRKDNDFYPDEKLLKKAIEKGVKFVISDDAHHIDELGYNFEQAEKALLENNCCNRFSL